MAVTLWFVESHFDGDSQRVAYIAATRARDAGQGYLAWSGCKMDWRGV